jgi:phosphatidylinositol-3-phosphatase
MKRHDSRTERCFVHGGRSGRGPVASICILVLIAVCLSPRSVVAQINSVKTVFVIVMTGQNWSSIRGSSDAPYINSLLLTNASASNYVAASELSVPNSLWLEAGSSFGVSSDAPPSVNHQSTNSHLAAVLMQAGVSWRTYQEGIDGTTCPVAANGLYRPSYNPFVFFEDVANDRNVCLSHIRPYSELATDLAGNNVARYNFIKPNLCNSMHQVCLSISNAIRQGDNWLAQEVPRILASGAYQAGGALFITWDTPQNGADKTVGMIVLSPFARKGYSNSIRYTHGSALRTFQEILGVTNFLGDAAAQASLEDLFLPSKEDGAAISLTWTPSPGASSYKVTRSTSTQGPYATVASNVSGTSYADRGLASGTTYFYSVIAVSGAGESPASPPVSVKPVVVPPTPLLVTAKQIP